MADLVIIAVPDDALTAVIAGLAGTGVLRPGQIVAHTSGAHGLDVLAPVVTAGATPLAVHPAMTFTGGPEDVARLAGISYGVTAPRWLRPFATRLIADLGGTVEWVAEPDRPLYHAALAHGANHLVTLVNDALDRLRESGVGEPATMLGPLLRASLENTLEHGDAALTGPVSRGDAGTVARHLERLADRAPETAPSYVALARRTAERGIAAGRLRAADAEPLLDVLAGGDPCVAANGIQVVRTRADLIAARARLSGTVAVVMTMGALHAGHESLIRAAAQRADRVIVTIFVNPLQFGPGEDFDRYPRTLDADREICRRAGVVLVFAPSRAEVYPDGEPVVRVNPGPLGERLEGASRPGFFHGVLTVVLRLIHMTRPDLVYFGEKDYQQLALVRLMVRDFDLPVQVVGVPTVREPDGLALSSRNSYLTPAQRAVALGLATALRAGVAAARRGLSADRTVAAARQVFDEYAAGGANLDYLVLADPGLGPAPATGPARLLIAARVGETRLIDNCVLEIAAAKPADPVPPAPAGTIMWKES